MVVKSCQTCAFSYQKDGQDYCNVFLAGEKFFLENKNGSVCQKWEKAADYHVSLKKIKTKNIEIVDEIENLEYDNL